MEQQFGTGRLVLVEGDITTIAADAIGNAANAALAGGGGVDGAIHRAGGPEIMAELRSRHPYGTPAGTAVATGAGALPARWVIHAVGPVWRGGDHGEPVQLSGAYRSALSIAAELGARTLTLPAISAGAYGYPMDEAAHIALGTVMESLSTGRAVRLVRFVLFGPAAFRAYETELRRLTGA
jgi:O-acetyl-ADP-ribose deacetylase (regulator of RNase III)